MFCIKQANLNEVHHKINHNCTNITKEYINMYIIELIFKDTFRYKKSRNFLTAIISKRGRYVSSVCLQWAWPGSGGACVVWSLRVAVRTSGSFCRRSELCDHMIIIIIPDDYNISETKEKPTCKCNISIRKRLKRSNWQCNIWDK